MKKLALFLTIVSLMAFSAVAMADTPGSITLENPNQHDGVATTESAWAVIDAYEYLTPGANRQFDPGEGWGNQSALVRIPLSALVPCHLEMEFRGNDMNFNLESWGPDAAATMAPGNYYIAFSPSINGYLKDWTPIVNTHGLDIYDNNAEVEPADDVFIRACDTFRTKIWSNLNYSYTVKVDNGCLTGGDNGGASTLPVEMRYAEVTEATDNLAAAQAAMGSAVNFAGLTDFTATLENGSNATQTSIYYQQFRVPFDRAHVAGHYSGWIEFKAATL